MAEAAIETIGLRKSYDDGCEALRGLDLHVPAGTICGFLGRNGAGKTTTIKVLLGMARRTVGEARVFGLVATDERASVDIRRRTGFVSDEKDLLDSMTVGQIIRFTAAFYPKWRADLQRRYLDRFVLPPERHIRQLSRGMRAKLALLLALCRDAELLILDEPTSGLDPAATEEVLQTLVSHVADSGVTVLFSTHQIAEVDQIADHVAIIDQGRIAVSGTLDDLRSQYRRIQFAFDGDAPAAAFAGPGVVRTSRQGRLLQVLASGNAERIVAEGRTMHPLSVDVAPVTLKDIFLETVVKEN